VLSGRNDVLWNITHGCFSCVINRPSFNIDEVDKPFTEAIII